MICARHSIRRDGNRDPYRLRFAGAHVDGLNLQQRIGVVSWRRAQPILGRSLHGPVDWNMPNKSGSSGRQRSSAKCVGEGRNVRSESIDGRFSLHDDLETGVLTAGRFNHGWFHIARHGISEHFDQRVDWPKLHRLRLHLSRPSGVCENQRDHHQEHRCHRVAVGQSERRQTSPWEIVLHGASLLANDSAEEPYYSMNGIGLNAVLLNRSNTFSR